MDKQIWNIIIGGVIVSIITVFIIYPTKASLSSDSNDISKPREQTTRTTNESGNDKDLREIWKSYEERIDSLEKVNQAKPESNPSDLEKITELQEEVKSLKSNPSTNNVVITKTIDPRSVTDKDLYGKWEVVNENAVWTFNKNGKMTNVYNRGTPKYVSWYVEDGTLYFPRGNYKTGWDIMSYENGQLGLSLQTRGTSRTLRKIQ